MFLTCTIFAAIMKQWRKRHLAAWVLLAIFLPTLLLASLHVHSISGWHAGEYMECVNHQPHAGHITDGDICLDECVLCQFLGMSYMVATAPVIYLLATPIMAFPLDKPQHLCIRAKGIKSNRAPPLCLLIQ